MDLTIKYSVHKTVTTKLLSQTPRVVRISVTDADATDSSGDERGAANVRRVRKHVCEIRLEAAQKRVPAKKKKKKAAPVQPWAERRRRMWPGTFSTAEEAITIRGPAGATGPPEDCREELYSPTSVLLKEESNGKTDYVEDRTTAFDLLTDYFDFRLPSPSSPPLIFDDVNLPMEDGVFEFELGDDDFGSLTWDGDD